MSSFDNGLSAGAAARLSNPAIISRAIPTKVLFPKFDSDFIAEYLSLVAFPIPPEALLLIESLPPLKVVRKFALYARPAKIEKKKRIRLNAGRRRMGHIR
jgi:hypothetical protein